MLSHSERAIRSLTFLSGHGLKEFVVENCMTKERTREVMYHFSISNILEIANLTTARFSRSLLCPIMLMTIVWNPAGSLNLQNMRIKLSTNGIRVRGSNMDPQRVSKKGGLR